MQIECTGRIIDDIKGPRSQINRKLPFPTLPSLGGTCTGFCLPTAILNSLCAMGKQATTPFSPFP